MSLSEIVCFVCSCIMYWCVTGFCTPFYLSCIFDEVLLSLLNDSIYTKFDSPVPDFPATYTHLITLSFEKIGCKLDVNILAAFIYLGLINQRLANIFFKLSLEVHCLKKQCLDSNHVHICLTIGPSDFIYDGKCFI